MSGQSFIHRGVYYNCYGKDYEITNKAYGGNII